MNNVIDMSDPAIDDAKRVLEAIVQNDFNRRIPGATRGLRWLRERGHISERPGFDRHPVLLSSTGRHLAIFWELADV